jgi:hypothetical protein
MRFQSIDERFQESGSKAPVGFDEMDNFVEQLQEGLAHASERPEIEGRILALLDRSNGPTTAGVAAEMRISSAAAEVHLSELLNANRVWSQPSHGSAVTWHTSLEGQHYLNQTISVRNEDGRQLFGGGARKAA